MVEVKKSHHRVHTKKHQKKSSLTQRVFFFIILSSIVFIVTRTVLAQNQFQPTCANSQSCKSDLSERIDNNAIGLFAGQRITPPPIYPNVDTITAPVLGASTAEGEKHIYVDLSTQTLYAYQGTTQVFKTLIASGRWDKTPVGNFHIWEKLRSTRMAGGEGADAYDLPNVPYVMYFYHDFGLHGAYWHDNFGHTMSHGCVNMREVDAKVVYDWSDGPANGQPGTAVSICDSISANNQCMQTDPLSS